MSTLGGSIPHLNLENVKMSLSRLSLIRETIFSSKSQLVKYIATKANTKMSAVMTGYGNAKLITGNGIPTEVSSPNVFNIYFQMYNQVTLLFPIIPLLLVLVIFDLWFGFLKDV